MERDGAGWRDNKVIYGRTAPGSARPWSCDGLATVRTADEKLEGGQNWCALYMHCMPPDNLTRMQHHRAPTAYRRRRIHPPLRRLEHMFTLAGQGQWTIQWTLPCNCHALAVLVALHSFRNNKGAVTSALWLILLASEFRRNYSLDPPLREPNVKRMVGVWGL